MPRDYSSRVQDLKEKARGLRENIIKGRNGAERKSFLNEYDSTNKEIRRLEDEEDAKRIDD